MKKVLYLTLSFLVIASLFSPASFAREPAVYLTVLQEGRIVTPVYSLFSFRTIVRGMDKVYGIVCSPEGNLYTAERQEAEITSYSQSGKINDIIMKEGKLDDTDILHLLLTEDGDLLFTTSEKGIWKIEDANSDNAPEQIVSDKFFESDESLYDLAFLTEGEHRGDLIVSVTGEQHGRVVRLPAPNFDEIKEFATTYETGGDGEPVRTEKFKTPTGLDVGPEGNVYVGDWAIGGGKILKYGPAGNFLNIFTDDILRPNGITIGSDDILYATTAVFGESVQGALRRYELDGTQKPIITKPGVWAVAVCDE